MQSDMPRGLTLIPQRAFVLYKQPYLSKLKNMAFASTAATQQILFATKRTTSRGRVARPTKVLAVAQSDSVGKQLRNGAAAGTLALSLLINQGSALAITSDSAYVLTLQAKEAEQIELVKQGRASPVAKNPELSAVLSFVAVSTVAVAGVSYYFDNSPTNRMYRVQQDEENAKTAAEEEKK